MLGVRMRSPERDIDLDAIRDLNTRAINRIRSLIPCLLAMQESERTWLNANVSGQIYRPELENGSKLGPEVDRRISGS